MALPSWHGAQSSPDSQGKQPRGACAALKQSTAAQCQPCAWGCDVSESWAVTYLLGR